LDASFDVDYMFARICVLGALYLALLNFAPRTVSAADELTRLKFNNPGLAVDLGVGLWAWPIPCDADGDGDFDLIVSCPDQPFNGVWLFENTTGPTAEEKFPVFQPPRRLSKTVHYVLPSYVDGKLRVLTPGKEYADFTKSGLDKPQAIDVPQPIHAPLGSAPRGRTNKIRHNEWRYADYDGDGATDLIVAIEDWSDYGWDDAWDEQGRWKNGPLHGFVYWLRNTGTNVAPVYAQSQAVQTAGVPVETYGCPTPNFADFDGDGDLDLLCGEFLDSFTYFENTGTRVAPSYAAGRRLKTADGQPLAMDLEMIVPIAFDWDTDGDLDLIVGDEDGRVALIENTGKLADDRSPQFLKPRYFQQVAEDLKCGALATPCGYDWDGDGDTDLISGNTAGYIELFENLSGPKVESPKFAAPRRLEAGGKTFRVMAGPNGSIQGPAEAKWGYTTQSVADWDMDGLPDIVLNSIWGRVEWLRNEGTPTAPRLAAPQAVEVEWPAAPPKPVWTWWTPNPRALVTQWRTTPLVHDFDGDGLPDLAMLDPQGYLALFRRARRDGRLVLLPPERVFVDNQDQPLRLNEKDAGGSGRRKLCVTDWNGDGLVDLLLNSKNAEILLQTPPQESDKQGAPRRYRFASAGPIAKQDIEGHDVSPTVVDFNGDGRSDFVGGAEDGHLYYRRHP